VLGFGAWNYPQAVLTTDCGTGTLAAAIAILLQREYSIHAAGPAPCVFVKQHVLGTFHFLLSCILQRSRSPHPSMALIPENASNMQLYPHSTSFSKSNEISQLPTP
jgi:hypothetical protein